MPTFQVRGKDGYTYSVEAPEGTPQSVLEQAVAEQGGAFRGEARQRTYGEALLRDPAAALTSGLGALVQFPAQLYALGTGDTETGLYKLGERIKQTGQGLKSPGLVARELERARAIQEAEQTGGQLSAFGTAFGQTLKDPALFSTFIAEQLPQLVVPFGAAKAGSAAGAARAALAQASLEEGAKQAARYGTTAAIGAGALQQGADIGAQAYEDIYKELIRQNIDPDVAKQTALDQARGAGASALVISTLAQKLPGARTIEQAMAKAPLVPGAGGRIGSGIRGLLGESASEVVEEVGGKLSANIAMRDVKPEQALTEGLGATAGLAALGGGTLGGVLGLLRTPEAAPAAPPAPPAPAAAAQPPEPPAGPVTLEQFIGQLPEAQQLNVLAQLHQKAKGSPEQTVTGPDGNPVVIPAKEPATLNDQEQAVYDLLTSKFGVPSATQEPPAPPPPAPPTPPPTTPPAPPTAPSGEAPPTAPPTEPPVEEPRKLPTTPEEIKQAIDEVRAKIKTIDDEQLSLLSKNGALPRENTERGRRYATLEDQRVKLMDEFGMLSMKQRPPQAPPEEPKIDYINTAPTAENTEVRMWKAKSGNFGVGVYDKDAGKFAPTIKFWPNQEQAQQNFDEIVSKSAPPAEPVTPPAAELPPAEPPTAAPPAEQPAGMTDTDLGKMFDDIFAEETGIKPSGEPSAAPAPLPPTEIKPAEGKPPISEPAERTVDETLASAGANAKKSFDAAMDGLVALFGGKSPGRLGSGFSFDEETYAKAKPYFQQAIASLGDAAKDVREAMRLIIQRFLELVGPEKTQQMKPYAIRFIQDTMQAPEPEAERVRLANKFLETFEAGQGFSNITAARKAAADVLGRPVNPGTPDAKLVDEAVELAGVMYARKVSKEGSPQEVYRKLQEFQQSKMPNLDVRDSTSIRNQAYSTPLPLAFVADMLGQSYLGKTVLEPTAGQGALLMMTEPSKATVNEINPDRIAALESQGFKVTNENAATAKFSPKSVDVVLANPPYGQTGETYTVDGYTTKQIDHAISLNALQAMKDDGRAVLLIGGPAGVNVDSRRDAYRGEAKRTFFSKLYNEYNVTDHFTVAGDLYAKQGTKFPVDVIVIDGRKQNATKRQLPAAAVPRMITTWDELEGVLNGTNVDMGPFRGGEGDTRRGPPPEGQAPQPPSVPSVPSEEGAGDGERGGRGGAGGGAGAGAPGGAARRQRATGEEPSGAAPSGGELGGEGAARPAEGAGERVAAEAGEEQPPSGERVRGDESGAVAPTAAEGAVRTRLTEAETQKLQVPYTNFSGNQSVNTLVATNHLTPIQNAFENLRQRVGNIDEYVRTKLNYTPEQFKKSFSAEQVEALALGIDNIERNRGFIIGDQTGIGKGRVVAGMIRYAILNKKIPVFVTQMPDLYGDIMRDLNDINMGDVRPLMTNNNANVPLDAEALRWFSEKQDIEIQITEVQGAIKNRAESLLGSKLDNKPIEKQNDLIKQFVSTTTDPEILADKQLMTELRAEIPERRGKFLETPALEPHERALAEMVKKNSLGSYDVIFTTYNQMNPKSSGMPKRVQGKKVTPKAELFFRHEFLDHFINDNTMLIMDEAHNIGRGPEKDLVTRGLIARSYINKAGGVFYSSATFAKNPEVLDAYNKTDLGLAFDNPQQLVDAIASVPMQQATSAMLVEAGQYLRRERSFEGIEYNNQTVEVSQEAAETLSDVMRQIVAFDKEKAKAVADLQADLDTQGVRMPDEEIATPQVDSTNFTSVMHNVLNTFLLAVKSNQTADFAIEAIRNGEKPVITVANTLETFLSDFAKANGIQPGQAFRATFADVLVRYLNNVRTVSINNPDGTQQKHYLTDDELGSALDDYNDALSEIQNLAELNIPVSPIDAIKQRIREAGYSIGEVTGRQMVVDSVTNPDGTVDNRLVPRDKKELKTAGKKNTIAKFNEGEIDALLINRSGSTGLSMHSSEKFADQRRRVMIIAQAELDINNHMQMLGRINRTGQVTEDGQAPEGLPAQFGLPRYVQLSANVPIELRPAAVLANKMAALNANTTAGGRKTAVQDVKTPDFMNRYGDLVAAATVGLNDELNARLGFPITVDQDGAVNSMNAMAKVTGRIGLLPLQEQTALYDELISEYNSFLEMKEAFGQNDLEAKVKPLDAKTVEEIILQDADQGSLSPFTAAVVAYKVNSKRQAKPLSRTQVLELQAKALNGKKPQEVRKSQIETFMESTNELIEPLRKLARNEPSEKEKIDAKIFAIEEVQSILRLRLPTIGETITFTPEGGAMLFGVVTDVQKKGKVKSPTALSDWEVKVAVVNGQQPTMSFRLTQIAHWAEKEAAQASKVVFKPEKEMAVANADGSGVEMIPILDAFDRNQNNVRENRIIIGGNLVRAKAIVGYSGNLISYTDDKGDLRQGFMMPTNFDLAKTMAKVAGKMKSPQEAIELMDLGGIVIDADAETVQMLKVGGEYRIHVFKNKVGKKIVKEGEGFVSVGDLYRKLVGAREAQELIGQFISQYNLDLNANMMDSATRAIIDQRSKPTKPPLQSIVPFQPVVEKTRIQTKRRIKFLAKQHAEGVIGDAGFIDGVKTALDRDPASKPAAPRVRGADFIRERLLNARRRGMLSDDGVEMALWFIDQNPTLLDTLGISIAQGAEGVSGEYDQISQIMLLVPQTAQFDTAVHEILHHLERMMPPEVQDKIRERWLMDITAAARRAETPAQERFFELLMSFHFGGPDLSIDDKMMVMKEMIKNGDVPYDFYQYVNPSEYWAVNATRLVQNRFDLGDTAWGRLKNWLSEFVKKIKGIFGLSSDAVLLKALDSIIKGDGKFQSTTMLFEGEPAQQIVRKSVDKVVDEAQKFLQKRTPLKSENFEGVDKELFDKLVPIYTPQRATVIDKFVGMRDQFWKRMAQGIADQYRTIKDYSEHAYMLARMSRTVDGALEGLMFHGEVYLHDGALDIKQNTKGLKEILAPVGKEVDRFLIWMALNREAQLAKDGKNSRFEDIEELMKRKEELADGDLGGKNRRQIYIQVRNQMNVLNRSVLQIPLRQGLIMSTEKEIARTSQRDDLTEEQKAAKIADLLANPVGYERFANDIWYIPFYREMEDGMLSAAMDSTGLPNQYFTKNIEGGQSPFGDLMENIVRNWNHILSASMKNRAAIETVYAAMESGDVAPNLKSAYVMENGQVYVRSTGELAGDGSLQGWMTESKKDSANVKVMIDGIPAYFSVYEPLLLESISSIGYLGPKSKFLSAMRDFKNLLQFGVTISPAFKVRNLFRDSIQAQALSGTLNVLDGWRGSSKDNPRYISALSGGAIFNFGSIVEGDQAALVKRLIKQGVDPDNILDTKDKIMSGLRVAWDKYQEWGNRSEAANRIALYTKLKDQGYDHLTASFMARDLLDFSMQGSWGAFRYLTQIVPFLNARIQGLYKLGRDGVSPTARVFYNTLTGKESDMDDKRKASSFSVVTGGVILASLALYFAFKDDDEYKKRTDWDRDNFWWFRVPGMDYALRIPKPFEIGAFGTLAERVAEQLFDETSEGKQLENSLRRMIGDTFALNPTPQMFKPLIDLYANKDSFTGAPIESAGMERLSKEERKTDNTSPLAIALSGVSNLFLPTKGEISPVQADYAIKAYFGWLGGTVAWASKHAVAPFQEGAYPAERWVDGVSLGFIRSLPATQSEYVTSFYENAREISQAMADMRHYAAIGDSKNIQRIMEDRGDKVALAKMYDNTSKQMAKLRQNIRLITEDPTMSGEDKRIQIDTIQLLIIDLAKQAELLRKSTK
jgi:hypothetical protein